MDTTKIIIGTVGGGRYTVTAPIIKEDYGLYLKIEGLELPSTYEVDFSNQEHNGTSVTMIGNADGVLIPSQFIKSGKDVFAFLYHVGVDFGRTVYKFRIPNKLRPDRTDETPTPEEQSVIDQTISALNDAVADTQDAQEAIENMSVSAQTLAEGSSATVTKTEQDGVVHLEFGIPRGATGAKGDKGDKGDKEDTGAQGIQGERGLTGAKGDKGDKGDTGAQGVDGQDGYSPSATVTKVGDTATITITDKNGTTTAQISDGSGGGSATSPTASVAKVGDTATITITDINGTTTASISDGKDGTNGTNGQDGYSPTASVSKSGGTATITITDINGTTTATISDGSDGQDGSDGADGYSPTASVTKSGGTATITITDKNGTTTATVSDGANGQNGTNGTDGTTFTPSVSNAGVISWTNDGGKQNPSAVDLVAAIPTATTQTAGKMSATDKGRLDTLYADYSSALTALGVS